MPVSKVHALVSPSPVDAAPDEDEEENKKKEKKTKLKTGPYSPGPPIQTNVFPSLLE
jgi:hypothetical protein